MRCHRFIIGGDLSQSEIVITEPGLVHQWREVLKLGVGDEVILSDGKGLNKVGKIVKSGKTGVEIKILRTPDTKYQILNTLRSVTLYSSILKRDNFEWVVEKATEVGVARIVPMVTERTVKLGFQRTRLEKIIKEASEQSGRTILPELGEPVKLNEALQGRSEIKFFFDLGGERFDAKCDLPSIPSLKGGEEADPPLLRGGKGEATQSMAIFIGPEGGWSDAEREKAGEAGCLVRSLGPLTLRAETAAIIATYLTVV